VLLPFCSLWDVVWDVLLLWYVERPPIVLHGCVFNTVPGCCYGAPQHPSPRELESHGVPLSMSCYLCALCSVFLSSGKGFIPPPSFACSLSVGLVPCRVWLVLCVLWTEFSRYPRSAAIGSSLLVPLVTIFASCIVFLIFWSRCCPLVPSGSSAPFAWWLLWVR